MVGILATRLIFLQYLFSQLFFRLFEFFRRWYVVGGRFAWRTTIGKIQSLDRALALRVTVIYFFRPLFGDESFTGRFFGFFFRIFRIILALALYIVIFLFATFLFILWALFPIFVISKIVLP